MRLPNWNENLNTVIDNHRDRPFEWGSNDCLVLVDNTHIALTGKPFAADWLGEYSTPLQASRWYRNLCKEQSSKDIIEAIDNRLERFRGVLPPIGSIAARQSHVNVVTGYALGVCVGEKIAFIGDSGLDFLPVQDNDIFWLV